MLGWGPLGTMFTSMEFTKENVREWFDYVDGKLYWKKKPANQIKIGSEAGGMNYYGYRRVSFKKREYMVHRLVWLWHGKDLVDGLQIDHINQIKTDNRIENLRQVDGSTNKLNNKACYVSYCKFKNKWKAYGPAKNRKQKWIGYFDTKKEAEETVKLYFEGDSCVGSNWSETH